MKSRLTSLQRIVAQQSTLGERALVAAAHARMQERQLVAEEHALLSSDLAGDAVGGLLHTFVARRITQLRTLRARLADEALELERSALRHTRIACAGDKIAGRQRAEFDTARERARLEAIVDDTPDQLGVSPRF